VDLKTGSGRRLLAKRNASFLVAWIRPDIIQIRIEQKIKSGQTHTLTQPEAETTERVATGGGKVVDLMSLLERSLEQRGGGSADSAARASKRKHSAARRRSTSTRQSRRA